MQQEQTGFLSIACMLLIGDFIRSCPVVVEAVVECNGGGADWFDDRTARDIVRYQTWKKVSVFGRIN